MSRMIEVRVDPAGQVKMETKGFAGDSCLSATRAFEKALGLVAREQRTAEFFRQAANSQQQTGQQ